MKETTSNMKQKDKCQAKRSADVWSSPNNRYQALESRSKRQKLEPSLVSNCLNISDTEDVSVVIEFTKFILNFWYGLLMHIQ